MTKRILFFEKPHGYRYKDGESVMYGQFKRWWDVLGRESKLVKTIDELKLEAQTGNVGGVVVHWTDERPIEFKASLPQMIFAFYNSGLNESLPPNSAGRIFIELSPKWGYDFVIDDVPEGCIELEERLEKVESEVGE